MSTASESDEGDMMRQRDEMHIFALRDQVRKENEESDGGDSSRSMVIDSAALTSSVVPAMNALLKEQKDRNNNTNIIEEKKDAGETRKVSKEEDNGRVEYTCALLECMVAFVSATCGPSDDLQSEDSSPTQQTSYNSLSFRRSAHSCSSPNTNLLMLCLARSSEHIPAVRRNDLVCIQNAVVHFEPRLDGLDEKNSAHIDEKEIVRCGGWDVVDDGA